MIRYRLVQVRQNQKKTFRVGGPQSPFSISSSFILSFVLLPFFLNTKMSLSVNVAKYVPLKGSSYIELPKCLQTKKAIVNVKNEENKCLQWALLSCLHPAKDHTQRVNKCMQFKELRFTGVDFPVPLSQMPKVERLNNLAINVFGYSKQAGIHPLYLTKDLTSDPINLLLITEVNDGKTKSYYCWIKDFNPFCHDQTKHEQRNSSVSAAYPPTPLSGHCKTI